MTDLETRLRGPVLVGLLVGIAVACWTGLPHPRGQAIWGASCREFANNDSRDRLWVWGPSAVEPADGAPLTIPSAPHPRWGQTAVAAAAVMPPNDSALREGATELWPPGPVTAITYHDGFWTCRSRHYVIRSEIDETFTTELAVFMDRVWRAFTELFPGADRAAVTPSVVVYASHQKYRTVSRDRSRGMFRWEYRDAGEGRLRMTDFTVATYADGPAQRVFANFPKHLLLHEGAHQVLQSRAGFVALPSWFQEGCAMFLEQWDLDADAPTNVAAIVAARRAAAPLARRLAAGQWTSPRSLAGLTALDVDGFGAATDGHYQQAEALFCFLMSRRDRRRLLQETYTALINGQTGPAHRRLLTGSAGIELERQFQVWVAASSP